MKRKKNKIMVHKCFSQKLAVTEITSMYITNFNGTVCIFCLFVFRFRYYFACHLASRLVLAITIIQRHYSIIFFKK